MKTAAIPTLSANVEESFCSYVDAQGDGKLSRQKYAPIRQKLLKVASAAIDDAVNGQSFMSVMSSEGDKFLSRVAEPQQRLRDAVGKLRSYSALPASSQHEGETKHLQKIVEQALYAVLLVAISTMAPESLIAGLFVRWFAPRIAERIAEQLAERIAEWISKMLTGFDRTAENGVSALIAYGRAVVAGGQAAN